MTSDVDVRDSVQIRATAKANVLQQLSVSRRVLRGTNGEAVSGLHDRETLNGALSRAGLAAILNERTLARALSHTFERRAATAVSSHPVTPFPVVIVAKDVVDVFATDGILCVDLESLGFERARSWVAAQGDQWRTRGLKVFAAVGRNTVSGAELVGLFDAIISRPSVDSTQGWQRAVKVAWLACRDPARRDKLPPEKTRGGVAMEDFRESLAQATLPSADPRRRD